MNIENPIWYLSKAVCPICEGQGRLEFNTCPNCGTVVLICEEEGSVFTNLKSQSSYDVYGNQFDKRFVCPNCQKIEVEQFVSADSQQIQNAGFSEEEYK